MPTDNVRKLFETNFFGWYELTRRVLPVMRKQGHGRIVNCSSVLGFVSVRFMGAYAATKHAVEGWTDTLRLELKGTGIEAIILQPGPIHTRMLDNARGHFMETVDVRNSLFRGDYGRELSKYASGNRAQLVQARTGGGRREALPRAGRPAPAGALPRHHPHAGRRLAEAPAAHPHHGPRAAAAALRRGEW